jgi:hypothetical protein
MKNNQEEFYKIGLSVHRYCRFYELMKPGYQIEIIYMVFGIDFYEAMKAETELHKLFMPYEPLKKFGGYRECFSNVDINLFKKKLNQLVSSHTEITENLQISWR